MQAAGEIPQHEGVDVAEQQVARFGARPRSGHIVQNPADLERAEIGGERQPRLGAEPVRPAVARQFRHGVCGACILPDQCVVHGDPAAAIPHHRSFALIRNPDGRQVARHQGALLQRIGDHLARAPPDLISVVLHPAWLRIDLLVFLLGYRNNTSGVVEHNESRAGSALVDGADIVGHEVSPLMDDDFPRYHPTPLPALYSARFSLPINTAALNELASANPTDTHNTVR